MLNKLKKRGFEIRLESHAQAILERDFPEALQDVEAVLSEVDVPITEIIGSGGGETKGTQRLRRALKDKGWEKKIFEIKKIINGVERESISHEVDHVKQFGNEKNIALEIEWNNKDPFFDRDLENFKRLHVEGAISVGIIITRGSSLQEKMRDLVYRFTQERKITSYTDLRALGLIPTQKQVNAVMARVKRKKSPLDFATAFTHKFVSDKFGQATTHWLKLESRVHRGVGNPCPLLLIGMPASIVSFDPTSRIEEPSPVYDVTYSEDDADDVDASDH